MKLNRDDVHTLGDPALGGVAQRWNPPDYYFYERNWRTQRGAWGSPDVPDHLKADVKLVVEAFHEKGTRAGLLAAHNRGLLDGARAYVAARADTEEELAVRLAVLRAKLARESSLAGRIREAFLEARLDEVREATARGHTPPQAVIDKPDIPRRHIPRWLVITSIAMSALALLRSMTR
jgi:hypothetical protein